ncbi:MAG: cytochrome c [Polyangia bacterium]
MLVLGCGIADAVPTVGGRFINVTLQSKAGSQMLATLDLDALPLRPLFARDVQYGKDAHLLGLPLAEIFESLHIPKSYDLALLRFDNGLMIPVDFRNLATMTRLAPVLARAATTDLRAPLVRGEVELPVHPPTTEDLRVVRFDGNKVAVADATLADVLESARKDLSPWLYADSLASIEVVSRAAWEALFFAGENVRQGQRIYAGTCVFCHAVRGHGGALGWDLADPAPIYSDGWRHRLEDAVEARHRIPAKVRFDIHVRFRSGEGGDRTMPALRGMSPAEVDDVWKWILAVSAIPLP